MHPIQTILHPTDFSESADHAFRLACSLARDHAARLVVMHVAPLVYPFVGEMIAVPPLDLANGEVERERILEKLEAMKPSYGGFPVEYRVEEGEPVERILSVAADVDAGLIVVGTHGRTGIKRFLMGSVAEHLIREAPCSVLAVKTPSAVHFGDMPREHAPVVQHV